MKRGSLQYTSGREFGLDKKTRVLIFLLVAGGDAGVRLRHPKPFLKPVAFAAIWQLRLSLCMNACRRKSKAPGGQRSRVRLLLILLFLVPFGLAADEGKQ